MEKQPLNPTKEKIPLSELQGIVKTSSYPKPRWMLNESVYDTTWITSKVGVDRDYFLENPKKASKHSFKRAIAPGIFLTDPLSIDLLKDIQNSLLFLSMMGKINRPKRIVDITLAASNLLLHANELREARQQPKVLTLDTIKYEELKDYLLAFSVDRETFENGVKFILKNWETKAEIQWGSVQCHLQLTTRRFKSLKHKILKYLGSIDRNFLSPKLYNREYDNANQFEFDIDFHLSPTRSTISNEISKLEALYTARSAQQYKFQHSPMTLFSSGDAIFNELRDREKTPLMPISVALHSLSSSLNFVRIYGPSLNSYLSELSKAEARLKLSHGRTASIRTASTGTIQKLAYEETPIPESLHSLNLTSWDRDDENGIVDFKELRNGMSVGMALRLYTGAMWIILASFTTGRATSLQTLKRNCFIQSPVDGLFDVQIRIPKSSERLELEDLLRPVPDLVYDYGLEFASLVTSLESRRTVTANEESSFLFGAVLSYRSYCTKRESSMDVCMGSLGKDYLAKCVDMFMDWSQSPLINNKRWYPRTHQYRKMFAVLYFHFSDQTGLEELCWFMGHSNLDQTFYYAEVLPNSEWMEEAEAEIARIGGDLRKHILADQNVHQIINEARSKAKTSVILEPLVRQLINEHKETTGQEIRFKKIEGNSVFFYFVNPKDSLNA
ncbi:hypothetical protein HJ014_09205 [Vibrio parahaemolyticus]|nr:hypothetical protein [Vibrio parahaemolyticus]